MIETQYLTGMEAFEAGAASMGNEVLFTLFFAILIGFMASIMAGMRPGKPDEVKVLPGVLAALTVIFIITAVSPYSGLAGAHYEMYTVTGELDTVESYSQDGLALGIDVGNETRFYTVGGGGDVPRGVSRGDRVRLVVLEVYPAFSDSPTSEEIHEFRVVEGSR